MNKKIFLIFFLSTLSILSQQGERKIYDLHQALEIATRHNFDIVLRNANIKASEADITQAFGAYLPSIDFSTGYTRTLSNEGQSWLDVTGNIVQSSNSYTINADASLRLFDGFAREANYSRAKSIHNSNTYFLNQTIQDIRFRVYTQYIDVVRNSQLVKIRRENLELGKKELERIRAQYESGFIPVNAVYSQEAELGNLEVEIINAENQHNLSKTALLATMGLSQDFSTEFIETSIPAEISKTEIAEFREKVGSISAAVNNALENRNDYKALTYSIEAAKSQVTAATAGYMPQLTAFGGWRWNYFEWSSFVDYGRSYMGLNLSLPIFDNFRTNYQIESAKLQVTQAEVQKQQIELSIKQSIQNAILNLEAAEKQLEVSERAIRASEKNFEITAERFRQGNSNVTDYTIANTQFITSQINRITAVYNYFSAQKEVEYAIGKQR